MFNMGKKKHVLIFHNSGDFPNIIIASVKKKNLIKIERIVKLGKLTNIIKICRFYKYKLSDWKVHNIEEYTL